MIAVISDIGPSWATVERPATQSDWAAVGDNQDIVRTPDDVEVGDRVRLALCEEVQFDDLDEG